MTKKDLIKRLAEREEMTIKDSTIVVDGVIRLVAEALKNNEKIQLTDFITMTVRERSERTGRNPLTKEEIVIPAGKQISYKTGKGLKNFINDLPSSLDAKVASEAPVKAAPKAPVAKKPVAKKPVAKKPVAKKPIAKKK